MTRGDVGTEVLVLFKLNPPVDSFLGAASVSVGLGVGAGAGAGTVDTGTNEYVIVWLEEKKVK